MLYGVVEALIFQNSVEVRRDVSPITKYTRIALSTRLYGRGPPKGKTGARPAPGRPRFGRDPRALVLVYGCRFNEPFQSLPTRFCQPHKRSLNG